MEQQATVSPEEKAVQERIASAQRRLEQAKAALESEYGIRDLERKAQQIELEAERAELTVKFTRELGERGVAWEFVPTHGAIVAVRYPHHTIWQEYRDKGHPQDTAGLELLVHGHTGAGSCLLHPDTQSFTKLCKEPGRTGLLDATHVVILSLAYVKENDRGKK